MKIVLGLLILDIIVILHEFGHFLLAKLCKVEVQSFSVGMGPVLLKKTIKGTEYRLSLVPFGGYCGMKGEKAFLEALEQDLPEIPKEPGSFYSVHPLKRIAIAFAGPLANILFAFIAFIIIAMIPYEFSTTSNKIVLSSDLNPSVQSYAAKAGLQTGDIITKINESPINNFSDLDMIIMMNPDKILKIEVERNGEKLLFDVESGFDKDTGSGFIGVERWLDPVIDKVMEDFPAFEAGLKKGDIIKAIDENPILYTSQISSFLKDKTSVNIKVLRDSEEKVINVKLKNVDGNAKLGVAFALLTSREEGKNFFSAIPYGIKEGSNFFVFTLKTITYFFKGLNVSEAVAGPIKTMSILGDVTSESFSQDISTGIINVLKFTALISISLFVMNLLPIPILDGGLILVAFVELLRRKPSSPKFLYRIQFVGIGFVGLLMVIAVLCDLKFIFGK